MKKTGKMMMKFQPKQKANNVYQLYIYDDVTDVGTFDWSTWEYLESETSAAYFKEQLENIPDNATIELYINSYGGSVKEGVAIYNQLVRHKAYKVGYVDAYACSVAFTILMACDHIVMGLGSTALAHNMWMEVAGNAEELRKAADDLDKMMETNRQIYLKRCNISEEELIQLMSEERFLTPEECLQMGFCDEVAEKTFQLEEDDPGDGEKDDDLDSEKDKDDSTEDESQEKMKQLITAMFQKQMQEIKQEIKQQVNPVPEPDKDKCINFFNQFLED